MLSGALVGAACRPAVGNFLDFWMYAAPYAQALVGSIIGLSIDVLFRLIESIESDSH
jgi:hypothetical protein